MSDETVIERVLRTRFPSVRNMYSRALWLGVVHEHDLLSDYSLGVLSASEMVSEAQETHPEDFMHYRGLLEVQRRQRVSRQKNTVSQCQSGHTYAFNKGRKVCPKCAQPFEQHGKFVDLKSVLPYAITTPPETTLMDIRDAVNVLNVPEGQKRVLKALISDSVLLDEEHILTATAKVTGLSRQRVHWIIDKLRPALKELLAA